MSPPSTGLGDGSIPAALDVGFGVIPPSSNTACGTPGTFPLCQGLNSALQPQ